MNFCVLFQAQLVDLRSDLYEVRATKALLEKEVHNLLLQLHACQLQLLRAQSGNDVDSDAIKRKLVWNSFIGSTNNCTLR